MKRNLFNTIALVLAMSLGAVGLAAAPPEEQPPEQPADGDAVATVDEAMVRFLNAAPNAQLESLVLTDANGDQSVDEFTNVPYGELSEYVAVPVGRFEVNARLASTGGEGAETGVEVPVTTIDTYAGEYYTVALIGLVQPEEPRSEDEGFFDWLEGLFTADGDVYALKTIVLSDGTSAAILESEAEVRIAHFAPGVDSIDLVSVNAEGEVDVIHSVSYGDVSGLATVIPTDTNLQVRAAGSEAVMFELADIELSAGRASTIVIGGTPMEQVPLDVRVIEEPQVVVNAGRSAVAPGVATMDAAQLDGLRMTLMDLEERIAEIQGRLENFAGTKDAQDDVSAALQAAEDAMDLVLDAREQVEIGMPSAQPPADTDGQN